MSRQRVLRQPRAGRDHDDANDVEDDRTGGCVGGGLLLILVSSLAVAAAFMPERNELL